MAELTTGMLRDAVRALDESDSELADEVRARDSELDAEFAAALRQLLTLAMQDQRYLGVTIDTVFALKGLERIGDHAKNIAEQVVFVASGRDMRHDKKRAGVALRLQPRLLRTTNVITNAIEPASPNS